MLFGSLMDLLCRLVSIKSRLIIPEVHTAMQSYLNKCARGDIWTSHKSPTGPSTVQVWILDGRWSVAVVQGHSSHNLSPYHPMILKDFL